MKFVCPLEPKPKWCSQWCDKTEENDLQRSRLYCFEESLADHIKGRSLISLAECKLIVEQISIEYKIPIPEVKDGRGLSVARAGYNPDGVLRIKLPRQYRYRIAVLHEAAHCIMQYLTRNDEANHQHHGPVYVRYLLNIYSSYLKIPLPQLEQVAKQFSLDF